MLHLVTDVDIFLFFNRLRPDSSSRLIAKCKTLGISETSIRERLDDFRNHQDYHARAVQEVVDTQLDAVPAAQIQDAGGGGIVMDEVRRDVAQTLGREQRDMTRNRRVIDQPPSS